MLKDLTSKIKVKLYQTLSNDLKYLPEIITQRVYIKTKSHFLKPLEFKSYLVQTEEAEHVFIVEIIRSSSFPTSWNETGEEPPCCVLTDKNFIIQTFTANCCDTLGFNSNVINANFEITSCIQQFNEDVINDFKEASNNKVGNSTYLFDNSDFLSNSNQTATGNLLKKDYKSSTKNIIVNTLTATNSSNKLNNIIRQIKKNNNNEINVLKNKLKRKLIKTKYSNIQIITWKINENYINALKYDGKKYFKFDKKHSSKNIYNFYYNKFLLTVKEIRISGVVLGYYFFFKKIKIIELKHNESNEDINYFKRYVSNTAEDEQSDYKRNRDLKDSTISIKQINKSNTEQPNNKSGFYLSQQILNKDSKENIKSKDNNKLNDNISETDINLKKSNLNLSEDENKNYSYYLISDVKEENFGEIVKREKDFSLKDRNLIINYIFILN
jgi:hypothetical protein